MHRRSVSILGCGWLGLPLSRRLLSEGYLLKGTTTSPEKISLLRSYGISAYLIDIGPPVRGDDIASFFQSEIFFLNIPFRRTFKDPFVYKCQIEAVISFLERSPVKKIIFASSTSVYPSDAGFVTEEFAIAGENPRAQVLLQIEQRILLHPQFDSTILRFAGLVGEGREIGRLYARRPDGSFHPEEPVNLVHLHDCLEIIVQLIVKNVSGVVLNVCCDHHPAKGQLYARLDTRRARLAEVWHPKTARLYADAKPLKTDFDKQKMKRNKIVSNEKLKRLLDYQFIYPDPLMFPL